MMYFLGWLTLVLCEYWLGSDLYLSGNTWFKITGNGNFLLSQNDSIQVGVRVKLCCNEIKSLPVLTRHKTRSMEKE
jgi:hypothetical protein